MHNIYNQWINVHISALYNVTRYFCFLYCSKCSSILSWWMNKQRNRIVTESYFIIYWLLWVLWLLLALLLLFFSSNIYFYQLIKSNPSTISSISIIYVLFILLNPKGKKHSFNDIHIIFQSVFFFVFLIWLLNFINTKRFIVWLFFECPIRAIYTKLIILRTVYFIAYI